ncbi:response regulator transcription factor [Paenibacillus ihbetae]|uniref:DNA-binding response regulator n=1 Tax=Paenibacillus ihbetae TaxID=1870820 RepID=A0ABX3JZ09_9BACL|nr:response regulator transcription factor [Paenibacillus ihbetae]OOC61864.1 DNA-binding response regulator [Paenibacillus ihbetae]
MRTILIIDDEPNIREVLVSYLQREQYRTLEAANGKEGLEHLRDERIDLIILDLMLPDMEGEQLCASIRSFSPVPVLMLTAKSAASSRLKGFSSGADDYVLKPFDPREVLARVKAILRRAGNDAQLLSDVTVYRHGALVIHSGKHEVTCHGQAVGLTPNEYKLLVLLAKYPGRNFSREELVERILGYDYDGDIRTIDQHVKNLRHKIEEDPKQPKFIITVYGFGYRFGGEDS